jgi:hypothetical protein
MRKVARNWLKEYEDYIIINVRLPSKELQKGNQAVTFAPSHGTWDSVARYLQCDSVLSNFHSLPNHPIVAHDFVIPEVLLDSSLSSGHKRNQPQIGAKSLIRAHLTTNNYG